MKKVFVCAGAGLAKNQNINKQAYELGFILAKNNLTYVQGGSSKGIMGETLKSFASKSKNIEIIIPKAYYDNDAPSLKEFLGEENFNPTIVNQETERLQLIKSCDHIIVMPGGTGTLEELLYANETSRANEHTCKIDVINIDGFFDGVLSQIQTNINEGLSKPSTIHLNILSNVNEIKF